MKYIGIDPGKEGGWGLIDSEGQGLACGPLPYNANELDIMGLLKVLRNSRDAGIDHIVMAIERPMARDAQSDTGILHSGMNFGMLIAIGTILGFRIATPTPANWKASMHVTRDKGTSMREANHLFPNLREFLYGPRGGARDGIAEALLIAEYQRRLDGKRSGRRTAPVESEYAAARPGGLLEQLNAVDEANR